MKRILATTALVMILSGGAAYADMGNYQSQPTDINASQFIGQRIYAAETMPADSVQPGGEKDWDDVGEINEVILDRSGQVKAVVLGVGGFLGMGEKDVAVPMNDVKFVKNGEDADDFFLVVNTNKDALTAAPAFVAVEDKAAQQTAASDAANTTADPAAMPADTATNTTMTAPADTTADATAQTPADTTTAMDGNTAATDQTTTSSTNMDSSTQAMTDENRTRLTRPEITREGYQAAEAAELTTEKLTGASVYGPNDENVAAINRIILDNNGKVERVVLDVGGFLGIGAREIAVTMDELNIVRNAAGDDFRVYIDANEANLKAQPEFKG